MHSPRKKGRGKKEVRMMDEDVASIISASPREAEKS
jgi:hypothetical protein